MYAPLQVGGEVQFPLTSHVMTAVPSSSWPESQA